MPQSFTPRSGRPVLEGFVRAKADLLYHKDYNRILPVLIHGDAALAGQGVVTEVAQMSQLKASTRRLVAFCDQQPNRLHHRFRRRT